VDGLRDGSNPDEGGLRDNSDLEADGTRDRSDPDDVDARDSSDLEADGARDSSDAEVDDLRDSSERYRGDSGGEETRDRSLSIEL